MQRWSQSVQWLSNVSTWLVLFKEQGFVKVWSCLEHKGRLQRTSEKCDVAHPTRTTSLKSLDSTNPQSDRLCTNGGNSRPLLPSREVVDQQRSLQSRTCNSLRGCKSSRWLMLMFMSPTSGEHWATMVCMAELQEKSHCFPKRTFLAKDHVDKPEDYWRKF